MCILLNDFYEDKYARLDEVVSEERIIGIEKAATALYEDEVDEERIYKIKVYQKRVNRAFQNVL